MQHSLTLAAPFQTNRRYTIPTLKVCGVRPGRVSWALTRYLSVNPLRLKMSAHLCTHLVWVGAMQVAFGQYDLEKNIET